MSPAPPPQQTHTCYRGSSSLLKVEWFKRSPQPKNAFIALARLVFDQRTRHHTLAKLTQKMTITRSLCHFLKTSEMKWKLLSGVWHSLQPCGLYSPWNSPGQNTGVDSHSLLQGIFPTQGLNSGLPHCRQILYWGKEPQGKPKNTDRAILFQSLALINF